MLAWYLLLALGDVVFCLVPGIGPVGVLARFIRYELHHRAVGFCIAMAVMEGMDRRGFAAFKGLFV